MALMENSPLTILQKIYFDVTVLSMCQVKNFFHYDVFYSMLTIFINIKLIF